MRTRTVYERTGVTLVAMALALPALVAAKPSTAGGGGGGGGESGLVWLCKYVDSDKDGFHTFSHTQQSSKSSTDGTDFNDKQPSKVWSGENEPTSEDCNGLLGGDLDLDDGDPDVGTTPAEGSTTGGETTTTTGGDTTTTTGGSSETTGTGGDTTTTTTTGSSETSGTGGDTTTTTGGDTTTTTTGSSETTGTGGDTTTTGSSETTGTGGDTTTTTGSEPVVSPVEQPQTPPAQTETEVTEEEPDVTETVPDVTEEETQPVVTPTNGDPSTPGGGTSTPGGGEDTGVTCSGDLTVQVVDLDGQLVSGASAAVDGEPIDVGSGEASRTVTCGDVSVALLSLPAGYALAQADASTFRAAASHVARIDAVVENSAVTKVVFVVDPVEVLPVEFEQPGPVDEQAPAPTDEDPVAPAPDVEPAVTRDPEPAPEPDVPPVAAPAAPAPDAPAPAELAFTGADSPLMLALAAAAFLLGAALLVASRREGTERA